jgi:NitT/TauT family transport system substrate-binding protein
MSIRRAALMVCAALAMAVTGAAPAPAADTLVGLSLDRPIDGAAAPFFVPLDHGWYRAAGVNVSVMPGKDMLEPITRVAAGQSEMALADLNELIKYRDTHPKAPIKAVFMLYNRPAYAIIARKSRGITTPKDLEGKRLGMPPGDPAGAQWPAFAKLNKIDTAKVKIESISKPIREPMLASGQIDAVTGQSYSVFIDLKGKGVPMDDIDVMAMADHGLVLYGQAIIVNTDFAAKHPDAVKGFLGAFLRGLKVSIASPAKAVDSVLMRDEALNKTLERERLAMVVANDFVTPEVKANGFGVINGARFARSLDQLALGYTFKSSRPKLVDVFDPSYLPPAKARVFR